MIEDMRHVPIWRHLGIGLVTAIALLFFYLLYISGQTSGLSDVNAIEYAVIARDLATRHTFSTQILKPISLAKIPRISGHPDLIYPPLHPIWEAIWLRLMGLSERAIPLACGAWLFLTGLLLFILGSLWFSARVGAAAAIFYLLNATMLSYAAGGLETPMLAFELLLLFAIVVSFLADTPKRLWKAVLIGITVGVIYLTKYVWGLAIIPVLVAVFFSSPSRKRPAMTLACLLAFVLAISPWLVRTTIVAGAPFFSFRWLEAVMNTRTYPGNTLYRTFTTHYPHWLLFAVTSPKEVLAKARAGLMTIYADPIVSAGPFVGAFFIAAILAIVGQRAFELGRYVIYATYVLVVLALLILFPAPRLTAPLSSVATLIAVAFYVKLLRETTEGAPESRRHKIILAALVILGILQALPVIQRLSAGRPASAVQTDNVRLASRRVASLVSGPIVTDIPWPIAWFGERTAIWLPVTFDDLHKIEDKIGPIQWLLLTPFVDRIRGTERTDAWADMWRAALRRDVVQNGYAVYKRLPGDWILFRRTSLTQQGGG